MISKELLLIPGIKKISIMLKDNILFTGDSNGIIRERKSEGNNLILISQKENSHNKDINILINIGNGLIISGSKDKLIKIW